MRKERKMAIARSMELLGIGLARPVRQIAAVVGRTEGWVDDYIRRGFAVVYRPWGAEVWGPGR